MKWDRQESKFEESMIEGSDLKVVAYEFYGWGHWRVIDDGETIGYGVVKPAEGDVMAVAKDHAESFCCALLQGEYGVAA